MKRNCSRILSLLLMLTLVLGLLSGITAPAEAATVNYVYSGKYIYNWGHRGTNATFLSPILRRSNSSTSVRKERLSRLNFSSFDIKVI